ncbi:AarF/UbiB family protein [Desulfobacterales bacterium HSG16]|nr:AarF/UbiB family protein [Desulfobacterales bacterium HSG16]
MIIDFEKQKHMIRHLTRTMKRPELEKFFLSFVDKMGRKTFNQKVADQIVRATQPGDVIPEVYSEYRQIVIDGILFLLSALNSKRLVQIATDQLLLAEDTPIEKRLIILAGQVPTFHKLGQIIARNRNVNPDFRKWLIQLENGVKGSDVNAIHDKIEKDLGKNMDIFSIQMDKKILSEASVGVVIAFDWTSPETKKRKQGAFKIVKPMVLEHLNEELDCLDEMAKHFDSTRHLYTLKDFGFIKTFQEVRYALEKELELWGEQSNLSKAFLFYGNEDSILIPEVLPFSTDTITAMELVDGCKVTDAPLSDTGKNMCANLLFKALLCYPVFSRKKETLFHGDPHAGNIYAVEGKMEKDVKVALLDWSLAGNLSLSLRINLLMLLTGVITENEDRICKALGKLSEEEVLEGSILAKKIRSIAQDVIQSQEYSENRLVGKTFLFIDKSLVKGVPFSRDLLLFRKAEFTFEGILYTLDPEFDINQSLFTVMAGHCIKEFPKRMINLAFPFFDKPERYESLMSNKDLQNLALFFLLKTIENAVGKGINVIDCLSEQSSSLNYFMNLPFAATEYVADIFWNPITRRISSHRSA